MPSSVLAPATTGAHHGHATPLALTTDMADAPALAAPSLVQPRHLGRLSHVIHGTWPATPHYGPREVTPATSVYAHATLAVMKYARPEPLLHNDYLEDQGFTWVASSESENAHRYAVYLWARGYTTALHPAASPAAFSAGHPDVQEHDIAVSPPVHMLSTGANIVTAAAAEHDVAVGTPANPLSKGHHHAGYAHRVAPHAPAPYRPPLLPPWPSDFDEGAQLPTAWSISSSISQMDRPCPPAPRHSAAPVQHLLAMDAPSVLQATQHQAAWYDHMYLAHFQERIAHPGFIAHDHAHSFLPPGGSRGWPVPTMVTVPVPPAMSSLLPTETGFGASAPPSSLWGMDASDQPPSDPLSSATPSMSTSASSSASAIMASSTPSPVLTADNIMRIVNERVNASLAPAASAVPVQAPPQGFKLKTFSGASKDWLDYNRSLTYDMEIPPLRAGHGRAQDHCSQRRPE